MVCSFKKKIMIIFEEDNVCKNETASSERGGKSSIFDF